MSRHAAQASALTVSVALGDHDATSRHATELLEEPSLVPPSEADLGTLNQQLPAKFFALNEHFRAAVGKLRDAAGARSDPLCQEEMSPESGAYTPRLLSQIWWA